MKKSITILAIALIALVTMIGSVNAATITASPATVEKIAVGDTVTVTVTTKKDDAIQFNMTYPEGFEYVSTKASDGMALEVNTKTAGSLKVVAYGAQGDTVTMTFKATAEVAPEATKDFVASKLILGNEDDSFESETATVTVKAKDPEEQKPSVDEQTQQPGSENQGSTSETNQGEQKDEETGKTSTEKDTNKNDKVGTDGNVIKKLPQTGTSIVVVAGIVAAIIAAAAIVKNVRK